MIAGKRAYDNKCEFHHRSLKGNVIAKHIVGRQDNTRCERCGWDEAPCDRHRLSQALGYEAGNVIVLCPNCHRLAHKRKAG